MNILKMTLPQIKKGDYISLFFGDTGNQTPPTSHKCAFSNSLGEIVELSVGTHFIYEGKPTFRIIARQNLPFSLRPTFLLECLSNAFSEASIYNDIPFSLEKKSFSLAVITLSDKGFVGNREDTSGPALKEILIQKIPFTHVQSHILPDEITPLKALVADLAYSQQISCIVTTGGTGLSPRDISPNALLPLIEQRLHGFEHAMMAKSLEKTPTAILSRAFCGIIQKSLLIAVPGSLKASCENMEAILTALPHALDKIAGDMTDCGR